MSNICEILQRIIIIILFAKLTSYIKNILDTTLSNRLTNVAWYVDHFSFLSSGKELL